LRDLDPDIVASQEIDCGRMRSRQEDQLGFIAAELGLKYVFCPSIEINGERYGHGLLAREEIHVVERIRLPDGGVAVVEPRDAMRAVTQLAGRKITLVATHLGLAFAERQAQIDRLLAPDLLGGIAADQPALFLGDLNLSPGGKLYRRLLSHWRVNQAHAFFRDAHAHAPRPGAVKTFPSFLPLRQLDHIFVTPHFRILAVHTLRNMLTRRTSDHLPLVADLELHG
jgi:endonuclease/exonuclease/phosphatase family metal-dependent hydrolase